MENLSTDGKRFFNVFRAVSGYNFSDRSKEYALMDLALDYEKFIESASTYRLRKRRVIFYDEENFVSQYYYRHFDSGFAPRFSLDSPLFNTTRFDKVFEVDDDACRVAMGYDGELSGYDDFINTPFYEIIIARHKELGSADPKRLFHTISPSEISQYRAEGIAMSEKGVCQIGEPSSEDQQLINEMLEEEDDDDGVIDLNDDISMSSL